MLVLVVMLVVVVMLVLVVYGGGSGDENGNNICNIDGETGKESATWNNFSYINHGKSDAWWGNVLVVYRDV